MRFKQASIKAGVWWVLLVAFMGFSRPTTLPIAVLIVPFILFFGSLYSLWHLIALAFLRYVKGEKVKQPRRELGITVCATLVVLLLLQSLGQLMARDVFTVVLLASLGYFYIIRIRSKEIS